MAPSPRPNRNVATDAAGPYPYFPYSGASEAHSAATGSAPAAAMSVSCRRMSDRWMPRRRYVGSTET